MQNIDWQIIATFLFILAAGGYAIHKLYLFFTSKTAGCSTGGCDGCGSKASTEPDNFVSIDVLTKNIESRE